MCNGEIYFYFSMSKKKSLILFTGVASLSVQMQMFNILDPSSMVVKYCHIDLVSILS